MITWRRTKNNIDFSHLISYDACMKKMILSRGGIYSKVYPRKRRMGIGKIRQLFWDFYALELLMAKSKDFFQHQRLENMLRKVTITLLGEQIMALEASVRGEIRYFIKACQTKNGETEACNVSDFLKSVYGKHSPISMDLATIEAIFHKSIWDCSYGGKSWGKATRTLIDAKKALEEGNLKDMIFFVDHIFDLHHNDGFILNKTNFKNLSGDLDYRHSLRTIKALRNYRISNTVANEVDSFMKCA